MLAIILAIILVLMVLALLAVLGRNFKLSDENIDWKTRYFELDKGMDEQADAYENDWVQDQETMASQRRALNRFREDQKFLLEIVARHRRDCLPGVNLNQEEEDRLHILGIEEVRTTSG